MREHFYTYPTVVELRADRDPARNRAARGAERRSQPTPWPATGAEPPPSRRLKRPSHPPRSAQGAATCPSQRPVTKPRQIG